MSDYYHQRRPSRMNRIAEEDGSISSPKQDPSQLRARSTILSPPNKENETSRIRTEENLARDKNLTKRNVNNRSVTFSPELKTSKRFVPERDPATNERERKQTGGTVIKAQKKATTTSPGSESQKSTPQRTPRQDEHHDTEQIFTSPRPTIARDQGSIELMKAKYRGPTQMHVICHSAKTPEDLYNALPTFSTLRSRDLTAAASRKDDNGRIPMHIISENRHISEALFNPDDDDDFPILQQSSSLGQEAANDKQVTRFVLDVLLAAHPTGMMWKDGDGFIPFQRILVEWIQHTHDLRRHPKNGSLTRGVSSHSGLSSASNPLQHMWHSTSVSVSTAITWAGKPFQQQNHLSLRSLDEEGSVQSDLEEGVEVYPTKPQLEVSDRRADMYVDSAEAWTIRYFPSHVRLTSEAKFAIKMLSAILDQLDEYVLSRSFKRKGLMKPSGDDDVIQSDSFDAAMDDLKDFCVVDSSEEIALAVVKIISSTPNLVKMLFLLDNEEERAWVLASSLFRRITLSKHSIGPWLTAMLQNPNKKVSYRGLEYLGYVSQLLEADVEGWYRNKSDSDRVNAKRVHDELHEEISKLEGFIPSLLALDERGIEEAATTLIVRRVLDRMISRPFAVSVVFFDATFLAVLIVSFRACVNSFLTGAAPDYVLKWIYVANACVFYFIIRELGKGITILGRTRQARIYFWSFWNITDILSTVLALCSTIAIRVNFSDDNVNYDDLTRLRGCLAVTTGLLWLRVFSLLKTINMQLATFVLAIVQITRDILWFLLILFATVVSFAQMFYTLLLPASCASKDSDSDNLQCSQSEYYLRTYTILLGDFGTFDRQDFQTAFSVFLIVFFSFMVVIVLLNVLIAIVSDSYEKCLVRSHSLFGRARVMLIAQLVSFQNLLHTNADARQDSHGLANIYSKWWTGKFWNQGWSRDSAVFFFLSTWVVITWIIGETAGYFSGKRYGNFLFSLGSILVNVILFVGIVAFLSKGAAGASHDSKKDEAELSRCVLFVWNVYDKVIQKAMLRLLGSTQETTSFFATGEMDDWRGRVHHLHKEMTRIAEESNSLILDHTKALEHHVGQSEARLRSEMKEMEQRMLDFKSVILRELKASEQRTDQMVRSSLNELFLTMQSGNGDPPFATVERDEQSGSRDSDPRLEKSNLREI